MVILKMKKDTALLRCVLNLLICDKFRHLDISLLSVPEATKLGREQRVLVGENDNNADKYPNSPISLSPTLDSQLVSTNYILMLRYLFFGPAVEKAK